MSRLNPKTVVDGDMVFTEFKGAMTEQYVFQQLTQNQELSIHYFTFNKSKHEIDFLVQTDVDASACKRAKFLLTLSYIEISEYICKKFI